MCQVSVVLPVRDEEKNIPDLISRISMVLKELGKTFEIIFVTDINRDRTERVLEDCCREDPHIKAIKLSNSFGQHVAVMAGLDHCSGEYTVIMDGDLQDIPEDIPLLLNTITKGFDIVYAVKDHKNDSVFRNICSRVFNGVMNRFSDVRIDTNTSMFRIISRKALEAITRFRERDPSLTYIFSYINLPSTTVLVRSGVRKQGVSKYNIARLLAFAVSSLLSFSRRPLRIISVLGIVCSLLSFLYLAVLLYQYFFKGIPVQGWMSVILTIIILGGIQLLSIGLIGEYIGRMYMETKDRPLYIVHRKFGNFEQLRPRSAQCSDPGF